MIEPFFFRKAGTEDIDRIWQIILQAKEQMRLLGSLQWQDGYPYYETISGDIEQGCAYVLCLECRVIAYAAIMFDGESAYDIIDGKWLGDGAYAVLHRLAVADEFKRQGIATRFMQYAETLCREKRVYHFRADTNFDNHYMQKIFAKCGFRYCGEIEYEGAKRLAYEKIL